MAEKGNLSYLSFLAWPCGLCWPPLETIKDIQGNSQKATKKWAKKLKQKLAVFGVKN